MKIRVLGCSGGIGGSHLRTTAFLIDHDILIDAGTGVGDLTIAELAAVDHVFITHSHLDHVVSLPFIMDSVGDMRDRPLTVHATAETIKILQDHIFNWRIWPDFSQMPGGRPFLEYSVLSEAEPVSLNGRMMTALPVNHTVPAVAYQLDSGAASLVFSGDTGPCEDFWAAVSRIKNLRYLLVECAFPDTEKALAIESCHYCPSLLMSDLLQWQPYWTSEVAVFITHLKPSKIEMTMHELAVYGSQFPVDFLQNHQIFEL